MAVTKKVRKQLTIQQSVMECAEKMRKESNRSFNNFIETLIMEACKK